MALVCPRCAGALPVHGPLHCSACRVDFPVIDGVPWLFPEPQLALAEWRHRLRALLASLGQQAAGYRAALGPGITRASTRNRLKLLAAACDDHARRLRALLAPLTATGAVAAPETYSALGPVLAAGQGLARYYANIHRDWAWGDVENRSALAAVSAALVGTTPGRTLVLGAGAGRLAYDIHARWGQMTVAADINPLFGAVARRMFAGERLELYEFPVAPRDIASHAVLRTLSAPAAAAAAAGAGAGAATDATAGAGLHYVLADAMQAPFGAGSFQTVITPWLIDVIDADLADQATVVNGWLAPQGRWISTGTLFFQQREPAHCHATEEVREIVADSGFKDYTLREKWVPYLDSPSSRHARRESVVTFVATKDKTLPARSRRSTAAWQAGVDDPIPLLPQVSARVLSMRVYAFVASLVDGRRSLRDIAAVLVQERLLPADEALGAVRDFLQRLHDEALAAPNS